MKISYHFFKLGAFAALLMLSGCCGCSSTPELDVKENLDLLNSFIQEPSFKPFEKGRGTTLYLDASKAGLDALKNSDIFAAMQGQLSQYSDTLVFIKGSEFDPHPLDRSAQTVYNALTSAREEQDVNYAELRMAVEKICRNNHQGIIITDFEYISHGKYQDINPYLSDLFRDWLKKGYQIDILIEDYLEDGEPKKLFYTFFTDPTYDAPITNIIKNEVSGFLARKECDWITINAKDYKMTTTSNESSCSKEIDMKSVKEFNEKQSSSSLYVIDEVWEKIKELVMKLDDHNSLIEGEEVVPLIDNLKIVNGTFYHITKLKLQATNISLPFFAKTEEGKDSEISGKETLDVTDAFEITMGKDGCVKIYVNKDILNEKHLYSEDIGFKNNLLKLEIFVEDFETNPDMFEQLNKLVWTSIGKANQYRGKPATCVSKSFENALLDKAVVPTAEQNKLLYTIFIQTESLN